MWRIHAPTCSSVRGALQRWPASATHISARAACVIARRWLSLNIGETPTRVIFVELKEPATTAKSEDARDLGPHPL